MPRISAFYAGEVVVGWLPRRALGFVAEWALLHTDELQANWDRARESQPLLPIEPLADQAFFAQVRVDPEGGTIVWPNGVDMAPEPLYAAARSHPAPASPAHR